jgi:hypothetical protein
MPRLRKTTSPAITDGEQKIAGMKAIDENSIWEAALVSPPARLF